MPRCRFGCTLSDAIALVILTDGCVVLPNDREQWLCLHHLMRGIEEGFLGHYQVTQFAPGVIAIDGIELEEVEWPKILQ